MKKKLAGIFDSHFLAHYRSYFFQTFLGALFITCFFLISSRIEDQLIIAPIGASTFIAFSFPKAKAAHPRFLIGGYITAAVTGCVFHYISGLFMDSASSWFILIYFLSFFSTMFLMAVLNFEHPPAAALAIYLTGRAGPIPATITAVTGICCLCLIKKLLEKKMINLSD